MERAGRLIGIWMYRLWKRGFRNRSVSSWIGDMVACLKSSVFV